MRSLSTRASTTVAPYLPLSSRIQAQRSQGCGPMAGTRPTAGQVQPFMSPPSLPVQPQRGGAIAVVEAVVGGKVLHVRLPGGGDRRGVQVHVVLLLRGIALDGVDELLARLQV